MRSAGATVRWLLCAVVLASGVVAPAPTGAAAAPRAAAADAVALAEDLPGDASAQFNAGVLLARDHELGRALRYLERARLLRPVDRDIQDARALVSREIRRQRIEAAGSRTITEGEPEAVALWRFFTAVPSVALEWGLLAASWLGFAALLVRRRKSEGPVRDALSVGAIIAGVVFMLTATLWTARAVVIERVHPAVVVAPEPRYAEAPDDLATRRRHADLYEGAVVEVLDERDGWSSVRLVDGQRAWVTAATVERLTEPGQSTP